MNQIALTGRLTRDPELRSTRSGEDVCAMRLASGGPEEANTVFVDVTAFGPLASNAEYLGQGRALAVAGRLAYSGPPPRARARPPVRPRALGPPSGLLHAPGRPQHERRHGAPVRYPRPAASTMPV